MGPLIAAAGALGVLAIMWDAFEALVLPRRVIRGRGPRGGSRPTGMFYRATWRAWAAMGVFR